MARRHPLNFSNFPYICLQIWLCRQMSRRGSREKKFTDRCIEILKKLAQPLLAKLHPSNLVNTIFYLVF